MPGDPTCPWDAPRPGARIARRGVQAWIVLVALALLWTLFR